MRRVRYPKPAEEEILIALKEYHYLTVDQVIAATGRVSLRNGQQRLKDLTDEGYLRRHNRYWNDVLHPLKPAYSLSSKAKRYLEESGRVVLAPTHPTPYFLNHTLALNDVLIYSRRLEREHPETVEVRELYHDRDLRRFQPALPVVPDGYVHFVMRTPQGRLSYPVLFELDMGTMDRRPWVTKVNRYVGFFKGVFQRTFQTDVATVAVITTAETHRQQRRLEQLRRWTESELTRMGAGKYASLFYFGHLTPELTPWRFFLGPHFTVAGDGGVPVSLLGVEVGRAA